LKQFIGGPSEVDVEALKAENDELKRKVEFLEAKLDEITRPKVRFAVFIGIFLISFRAGRRRSTAMTIDWPLRGIDLTGRLEYIDFLWLFMAYHLTYFLRKFDSFKECFN
jgi:uncharacterized protein with ParB-like and HNH nuclease domain